MYCAFFDISDKKEFSEALIFTGRTINVSRDHGFIKYMAPIVSIEIFLKFLMEYARRFR